MVIVKKLKIIIKKQDLKFYQQYLKFLKVVYFHLWVIYNIHILIRATLQIKKIDNKLNQDKKQKMFAAMNPNLTPITRDHNKKLVKIIQTLLAQQQSILFRKPIAHKSLGWEDYKQVVKKPMDLNLVRRQYNEGKYKTIEQFLDDIQTIWWNVFTYGKKDHQTYQMAIKMQKHFDQLLHDLFPQINEKIDRSQYMRKFQTPAKVTNKQVKKQVKNIAPTNNALQKQKPYNYRNSTSRVQKMDLEPVNKKQEHIAVNQSQILGRKKQINQSNKKQNNSNIILTTQTNNILQKQQPVQKISLQTTAVSQKLPTVNNSLSTGQSQIKINPPTVTIQESVKPQILSLMGQLNGPPILSQSAQNPLQIIQPESQPQNQLQPIAVNLNRCPTLEQVSQLTQIMKHLFKQEQFELIEKIVKILTKYEKQNMIIDGQDVNFRMSQIHISTYERIKKQLDTKTGLYMNGNSHHIMNEA